MDPLDILLAGGGIRAAGPTPLYDRTAGRRRIAEKLAVRRAERRAQETDDPAGSGAAHEGRWRTVPAPQLPRAATRPGPDGPPLFPGPGGPVGECSPADAQGLTHHDHADRYLRALAGVIIGEDGAADALKRLHDGTVEPHGALVFACLLHLVGRYQEAQFWWQFAGGAENAAACLCLYLHHVRLGEMKAAEHWFAQAVRPEVLLPGRPATAAFLPPVPGCHLACLPLVSDHLTALGAAPHPPDPALREALDDLDIVRDAEYGPISLPSDDLAGHLHDLATTS
ncbi:hypothetical protein ACFC26_06875 [Kitasatospora purpeofusca]|uniref:hypothetical protein n=1 Tax=Kitasatospora purpeofusca TaxID=67352 RepID=UPI0035E04B74